MVLLALIFVQVLLHFVLSLKDEHLLAFLAFFLLFLLGCIVYDLYIAVLQTKQVEIARVLYKQQKFETLFFNQFDKQLTELDQYLVELARLHVVLLEELPDFIIQGEDNAYKAKTAEKINSLLNIYSNTLNLSMLFEQEELRKGLLEKLEGVVNPLPFDFDSNIDLDLEAAVIGLDLDLNILNPEPGLDSIDPSLDLNLFIQVYYGF
jgi:hypothetical protein